MFLLVPAYPGCPGSKAVKRSLLLIEKYVVRSYCFYSTVHLMLEDVNVSTAVMPSVL